MDEEKPIPKRVYIRTGLTQARVNDYWKVLGFSRDYWMRQCSPAQRYEQVLDHLLNLEQQNRDNLDNME